MYDNEKSPLEMIKILPKDEFNKALIFINLGNELKCKANTRYAHANKYWRCVFSRKKPSRVLFTVECTEEWWRVKACLKNSDKYQDILIRCSEKIRNIIINAHDCESSCDDNLKFTFEDKQYQKCIGCGIYFSKLDKEDWNNLALLITKEHESANTAV